MWDEKQFMEGSHHQIHSLLEIMLQDISVLFCLFITDT